MKKIFVFLSVFVFYSISCASVLKITPEEERYPQIIAEKAYTEFNNKKYKKARDYYQYIIDNFDRENYSKEVAWAYYEIGFCYYYQKKYKFACVDGPEFDAHEVDFANLVMRQQMYKNQEALEYSCGGHCKCVEE